MIIRLFEPQDVEQIAQLFHNTVRRINIQDYSLAQVEAWSPDDLYFRDWLKICSSRFTYVAEDNDQIIGFGELEENGHIDCFYVHHKHQGQKVGTKIYQAIKDKAIALNISRLYTEASITARPFFLKQGFSQLKEQQVVCRGEKFTNYLMENILTSIS